MMVCINNECYEKDSIFLYCFLVYVLHVTVQKQRFLDIKSAKY